MEGHSVTLYLLLGLLGPVHCQFGGGGPNPGGVCGLTAAIPCINFAIKSYVQNTKGKEAATRPADQGTTILVAQTMTGQLYNPVGDLNATCEVLTNIDTGGMVRCLQTASRTCRFQPPATLSADTLPSLALNTIVDTADLTDKLCTPECKDFPLAENIATMKECRRIYETSIADLNQTNLTERSDICNVTETYLQCQWNQSVGCPFLEFTTENYVTTFNPTLSDCGVVIVPTDPPTTTTTQQAQASTVSDPITSTGCTVDMSFIRILPVVLSLCFIFITSVR